MRSSPEWNEMTPRRPPAVKRAGACASAFRSAPGSSLTAMRTAWKVRVATWRRRGHAGRGTAPRTAATRSPVRARRGRAPDGGPRDAPRGRLLAVLEEDPRRLRLREPVQEHGRALTARGIQPHVEGLVALEGEAAPRLLELPRGDTEVHEDRA